jgi:hypothetical protein
MKTDNPVGNVGLGAYEESARATVIHTYGPTENKERKIKRERQIVGDTRTPRDSHTRVATPNAGHLTADRSRTSSPNRAEWPRRSVGAVWGGWGGGSRDSGSPSFSRLKFTAGVASRLAGFARRKRQVIERSIFPRAPSPIGCTCFVIGMLTLSRGLLASRRL